MLVYARLSPDSPRRADWFDAIGADWILLESVDSDVVRLPGLDGPRRCYRADINSLDKDRRIRLDRFMAERYLGKHQYGASTLLLTGAHGLPILDGEDLIVTVEADFYL